MIGRFYSCMFCIHGDFQSRSERDFHTVACKARYLASNHRGDRTVTKKQIVKALVAEYSVSDRLAMLDRLVDMANDEGIIDYRDISDAITKGEPDDH